MAIQGSQDIDNVVFKASQIVRKERDADLDSFKTISNTDLLGDMPSAPRGNAVKCANVNELSQLVVEDGDAVELQGYYAKGDGGGQTLYYDLNSSATVDNGFVFNGPGNVGRFIAVDQTEVNVKRFGAKGDGITDDTAILSAAILTDPENAYLPPGSYLISANIIPTVGTKIRLRGATIEQQTADRSIIIVADVDNPETLIEGVSIEGGQLGPMPDASSDNWAAINLVNCDAPLVYGVKFKDIWTGLRLSYILGEDDLPIDASRCRDATVMGVTVENHGMMGIEAIQSQYSKIIGLCTHNNGVRGGNHSVRLSGENIGSILSASVLRDSGTTGVSVQEGAENCIVTGTVIENPTDAGIQTHATSTINGRHIFAPVIVRNSGGSGFDLNDLSGCIVQGIAESPAGAGLRTSTIAAEGRHICDVSVRNSGSSGAIIGSDKNIVRVLVDANTAGVPISITGNDNIVIVIAANTTVNNAIFVSGDRNTIVLVEAGSGGVGLRIDGSYNTVIGNITNEISITGNNNTFQGSTQDDFRINGSNNIITAQCTGLLTGTGSNNTIHANIGGNLDLDGNDNLVTGRVTGSIVGSGTGNDLKGLFNGTKQGSSTASTDANGDVTITHGLIATPQSVCITNADTTPRLYAVTAKTSTTFTVRCCDATGAAIVSTAVAFDWKANV